MTTIAAPHPVESTTEHYAAVKAEMAERGAPEIRAVWCESHGIWLAIEGSHRLAIAKELGLLDDVTIVDVTEASEIEHDLQDYDSPCAPADLADWLLDERRLNGTKWYRADVRSGHVGIESIIAEIG